ncbi:histone family protein nucleoid-structuring protein H-NS [Caballeronia temeraria]|uniref:Histone family protein nucleoid-structuring protein H-NS n=1 Tax=Caballeronia temeraria TaxID=1777137 RepID=A0A158DTU0_9BURK|nr:H-NS histone family protein [Caballeronia temeraria]SAK98032.1 histone family protein nucleoid-structuring protein H-NS [Caballeronia temeraria]
MAYTTPEITKLLAKQDELNKQLAEAKERETRLVLIEIVQKMREYGINLQELLGSKPKAQEPEPEPVREVKYRDPVGGGTWSGRGRAPNWIVGKNRDDFLADRRVTTTSKAAVQAALFGDDA